MCACQFKRDYLERELGHLKSSSLAALRRALLRALEASLLSGDLTEEEEVMKRLEARLEALGCPKPPPAAPPDSKAGARSSKYRWMGRQGGESSEGLGESLSEGPWATLVSTEFASIEEVEEPGPFKRKRSSSRHFL